MLPTKDLIFYTDGDAQFDMQELSKLVPFIYQCDVVSCYRLNRQDSLWRIAIACCWGRLVFCLLGVRVRDINCAFKLYRCSVLKAIDLKSTGALIDAELLARAMQKGFVVKQIGVHHYPRTGGCATGASPRVILQAFTELLKLHLELRKA